MIKVFLGGTCNESLWRDRLIAMLDTSKVNYYNPVVLDWIEDCQIEERRQREICDYCLYCITPRMRGVYSIAEVVEDSIKRPEKTIFVIEEYDLLDKDRDISFTFDKGELKSLVEVGNMVERNGGIFVRSLEEASIVLTAKSNVPQVTRNVGTSKLFPDKLEVGGYCMYVGQDIFKRPILCEGIILNITKKAPAKFKGVFKEPTYSIYVLDKQNKVSKTVVKLSLDDIIHTSVYDKIADFTVRLK